MLKQNLSYVFAMFQSAISKQATKKAFSCFKTCPVYAQSVWNIFYFGTKHRNIRILCLQNVLHVCAEFWISYFQTKHKNKSLFHIFKKCLMHVYIVFETSPILKRDTTIRVFCVCKNLSCACVECFKYQAQKMLRRRFALLCTTEMVFIFQNLSCVCSEYFKQLFWNKTHK